MNLIPENNMERILNGEDVTPSCRAEYFVKQAIANAGPGGGGDTYETVAELAVGEMTHIDTGYMYEIGNYEGVFPKTDLYFNSSDIPLTHYTDEGADQWLYNATPSEVREPYYGFSITDDKLVVLSSEDISNTTVTILKKAGGETITVDSELSETSENPVQNKVITAALADKADIADLKEPLHIHATESSGTITITDNVTPSAMCDAGEAGRAVFIDVDDSTMVLRYNLSAMVKTDADNAIASFSNTVDGGTKIEHRTFNVVSVSGVTQTITVNKGETVLST